ncbi:MAG: hypothetical protein JNK82_01645 [Myxococcaceae bacterium]|nr:hypothetical protein [Myxococcaceae bacterium]
MRHPGQVTFADLDAGTEKVVAVDTLPEAMRFGTSADGVTLPVTRVEARLRGKQRVVRELGPGGEVLRSTVQRSIF